MKRSLWFISYPVVALFVLLLAGTALAQPGGGSGRRGGGMQNRLYDVNTVETVKGEVVSVETMQGKRQGVNGLHLKLSTGSETISVHVGPQWYLSEQGLEINKGDKLEIKGSRIQFSGQPAIIAAQIKKESHDYKLRDDQGLPLWRGQRGR